MVLLTFGGSSWEQTREDLAHLQSVSRVCPSPSVFSFEYNLISLYLSAATCLQGRSTLHKSCLCLKSDLARSVVVKSYFWKQFKGGKKANSQPNMVNLTAAWHPFHSIQNRIWLLKNDVIKKKKKHMLAKFQNTWPFCEYIHRATVLHETQAYSSPIIWSKINTADFI